MDGRDFGPPRSVHVPPPLLAGLAMEHHRLGAAAAAGRIPPSPGHLGASHPPPLHSGKFLPSAINLHSHHSDAFPAGSSPFLSGYPGPTHLTSDPAYRSANPSSLQMAQLWASHAHEGYPPMPSSLYSSPYLSLGHLEPPSLSQHPIYDSHKEGFYLPASLSSLHPPPPPPTIPSSSTPPQRTSRDSRDKPYRGDRDRDRSRDDPRPHSVVDLTQDSRGEEERRARSSERDAERDAWAVHSHLSHQKFSGESRPRPSPPRPHGSSHRLPGTEMDNHHSNHSSSERQRRNESVATSAGPLHVSYGLPPPLSTSRESMREQRVTAPTYVPSVEVYDERAGPIQIASQARDNKHNDKHREQDRDRVGERGLSEHPRLSQSSDSNHREEGSVICSNGLKKGQDISSQSRFSPEARDVPKHSPRQVSERANVDSKWNTISPLANYATSHMAALAAQHGHALSSPHSQPSASQLPHSPHAAHRPRVNSSHCHSPHTPSEESSQRRYLDPSTLYRPGAALVGGSSSGERVGDATEVSAMQSLIKYSGNFSAEGGGSSRLAADGRGPFGGLGNIGSQERERDKERERERDRMSGGLTSAGALRVPPQLKREQERPDSARSFGREGEGEVRHPPVGIAVAVARQRDSSSSKQSSGTEPQRAHVPGVKDEERGQEHTRHHDDRLLGGRLEREQEKVLRESKELAEFTQMHPTSLSSGLTPSMMTPSLMNPNLMVTGGATLSGAGRWPPDPSTLTSHPWMSRSGAPPVWLSSSPYSLGPSSLHQTLPPAYPPSLAGSIPPPYQFARDPQSGQLLVIPTEHLPHYAGGDVLERGAPVWSSVYGTGSSLQHAAQLQLLSQQQMLRQQELLMIQQHTAQVLELQRNAQLVERLKAVDHRPVVEDKPEKRNMDSKPSSMSPTLHPRKPAPPSHSPPTSTSSLISLPPTPSPVTTLKSEEVGQRTPSHPPTPLLHPSSPLSASPPPSSPRRPKREPAEDAENVRTEGEREVQKPPHASYPGAYTGNPEGYPYQSITAPFGSPFPTYHIPPPTGSNTEVVPPHRAHSPSKVSPLPAPHLQSRLLDSNNKPPKLESSKSSSLPTQEPNAELSQLYVMTEPLGPLRRTCSPVLTNKTDKDGPKPQPITLNTCSSPPLKNDKLEENTEEEKIKMKTLPYSYCSYPAPPAFTDVETKSELIKVPQLMPYPLCMTTDADGHGSAQKSQDQTPVCEPEPQNSPINLHILSDMEKVDMPSLSASPLPLIAVSEDPMAGMLALLAASEMARPGTPPAPTLTPQMEYSPMSTECSMTGALEMVALEGMALLSQMAQQEMEKINKKEKDVALEGLDYLLEASQQILLEAIEKQSHIQLPRDLDPNKKYSWRQRKEEPLFSKMSMDVLDAFEVEYRVRLAEIQKTYKDKQREFSKLQRRTDKHEHQQDDDRRSLTRRGRGRPRKRKLMATPIKLDSRPGKVGRTVQYSEDSEAGDGQRKRLRLSKDDEGTEAGPGGVKVRKKKKKKSWKDQGSSGLEVLKTKRNNLCEQEQLASDLNRALSLSQLSSLASSHKLSSSKVSKGKATENRLKERNIHASIKGTKHKMSGKKSSAEKVKSQKKRPMFSPLRSELSSCSNNSDSEEHVSPRGGWPPLSNSRSCDDGIRKRKPATSPSSLLSSQKSQKKKHKHLSLLLEEAGLSSSDDSFDQETSEDEEEDSCSEGICDESGLGLLARFAASALPASSPARGLLHNGKQRNRQSTLGSSECEMSDSDLRMRKFPSLLHGKRSAPELPLLPPATHRINRSSPTKRDDSLTINHKALSKPRTASRSPRRFSFEQASGSGFGGFSEDEGWNRRRSERIFLNDATASTNQMSVSASTSASQITSTVSSPAPSISLKPACRPKPAPNREGKDVVKQKKKLKDSPLPLSPSTLSSLTDGPGPLSLSPVRKSQTKAKPKAREPSRGAVSRLMESMAADEDFEPNQDSSFSEDELLPSCDSSVPETSPPPAPVQCVLDKDSLVDGLRVLIPMDDQLLYAGHVNTVHSPDIYSVVVEGERGNRPHIYCLEQLLQEAIIDVKPPSVRYLPEGTRIAAYWSQQYRCLYPGTVVNGNSDIDEDDNLITVEFDDGDTGRIPLSHIRLLPPDYKIHCAEPSPALLVASCSRRRVRKCSKEGKEAGPKPDENTPKIKGKPGRKPKPKPETTLNQDDREKKDTSSMPRATDGPPAKLNQDRTPSAQKVSQDKPRPASRPSMEIHPKPKSKRSSSTPTTSPTLSSPVPRKENPKSSRALPSSLYPSTYGKVLTVDLYTEPNLSSYNNQRRDKDNAMSPTSHRPMSKSTLSKPSVAPNHKQLPSSKTKPSSSDKHRRPSHSPALVSTSINRLSTTKPTSLSRPSSLSLSSASRPKLKMPSDQLSSRTSSLLRPKSSSTQNELRRKPSAEPLVKLDHEGVTSPKTKKTKQMLLEGKGVRRDHTPIATANQKPPKPKIRENDPIEKDLYKAPVLAKEKKTESVSKGLTVEKREEKVKREEIKQELLSSSSSDSEEDGDKEKVKKKRKKCTSSCSSSSSSCCGSSSSSSSSSSSTSSSSTDDSSCSSDEERNPSPLPGPASPPPTQDKAKEEAKEEPREEVKKEKVKEVKEEEFTSTESPSASPTTTAPDPVKPNKPATGKGSGQRGRPPKQKPSGGEGKVGRPKRREGVHLPTTKELAKRQRLPSVENRPKISAFLPARQLWKWFGKPTQRRGMKGKAKKLFYKAIVRGREMIRIGDCAVFLSAGRPNLPFIGRIQSMWESWGSNMVVRVNWFYHPEETNPGKKLIDKKNWDQMCGQSIPAALHSTIQRKDFVERALYQSSHSDENDVQTVSHKCLVVSVEEYEQMTHTRRYADSEDLYYLAGTYEPTTGMIFNTDGVPVIC